MFEFTGISAAYLHHHLHHLRLGRCSPTILWSSMLLFPGTSSLCPTPVLECSPLLISLWVPIPSYSSPRSQWVVTHQSHSELPLFPQPVGPQLSHCSVYNPAPSSALGSLSLVPSCVWSIKPNSDTIQRPSCLCSSAITAECERLLCWAVPSHRDALRAVVLAIHCFLPLLCTGRSQHTPAHQPAGAVIKHHFPGGGRTADFCCSYSDKQPSQGHGANREGGELKGKGGSSFLGSLGQKVWEGERGGGNRKVLACWAVLLQPLQPLAVISHLPAQRCNTKVIPVYHSRFHFYSTGG